MHAALTGAPASLLGALRRARSGPPGRIDDALRGLGLRPLAGGRQNHVYLWTPPGEGATVIKVYRADDRRRAGREWAALTLLAAHEVGEVPRPLWMDPDPAAPAIGMSWLHGRPLLEAADRRAALRGLARTTARMQSVPVSGLLAGLPRVDSASHYVHRLTVTWPAQLAGQADDPLTPAMLDLLSAWQRTGDRALLAAPAEAVAFSHGDGNLLNWLTSGTRAAPASTSSSPGTARPPSTPPTSSSTSAAARYPTGPGGSCCPSLASAPPLITCSPPPSAPAPCGGWRCYGSSASSGPGSSAPSATARDSFSAPPAPTRANSPPPRLPPG